MLWRCRAKRVRGGNIYIISYIFIRAKRSLNVHAACKIRKRCILDRLKRFIWYIYLLSLFLYDPSTCRRVLLTKPLTRAVQFWHSIINIVRGEICICKWFDRSAYCKFIFYFQIWRCFRRLLNKLFTLIHGYQFELSPLS